MQTRYPRRRGQGHRDRLSVRSEVTRFQRPGSTHSRNRLSSPPLAVSQPLDAARKRDALCTLPRRYWYRAADFLEGTRLGAAS